MNTIGLSWYISGIIALLAILSFFIPVIGQDGKLVESSGLTITLGFVAFGFTGFALYLRRLPPSHRIRHSKPLLTLFVVVATVVTLLLIMIG